MRLHVDMLRAEDLPGAIARDVLHHISNFAAAVVALAGVALGVFVGEDSPGCLKHGARDEVL